MSLFRLDASIRLEGSASRELADLVEAEWVASHPGRGVHRREIGVSPLPSGAWANAIAAGFVPDEQRTADQRDGLALAAILTDELLAADAVLLAVPLYNFGVSQHVKNWIDLVIADPRAGHARTPLLEGKPTVLATVRGGLYQPGTPRDGWDHSTGYLRRILQDVWGADLTVVERELTLAGVNPALDPLLDVAAEVHASSRSAAEEAGRSLAAWDRAA